MKRFIVLLLLILAACQAPIPVTEPQPVSEPIIEQTPIETSPEPVMEAAEPSTNVLSKGTFEGKAHAAKGNAVIVEENGKKLLRLEGFETDPGPDLFIVLAPGLDGTEGVSLGMLESFSGDKEYVLDDSIDLEKNKNVLVWCKQYGVLFSSAELT